jgi:long-chain acyl-CoA synthetase
VPPQRPPVATVEPLPELAPPVSNLAQLVTGHALLRPGDVALVQPEPLRRSLTWSELEDRVAAVASGLATYGLVAGHRVGLHGPNSTEFVVAYLAALLAGFVAVPLNPESTPDELGSAVKATGTRVLLSATEVALPDVRTLPLTEPGLARVAEQGDRPVTSPADPETLAVLLHTAGTSGDPKVVTLTHRALLSHLEHFHAYGVVDPQTVVLAVLPLFHVFGLNAVLGSWARAGARLVVQDGTDDLLRVVVDEQVTNLPVAPSVLYRLLNTEGAARSLSGLTTVVSGAAPLPTQLASDFLARTGLRVEQGYGLTEAGPGVTVTLGGPLAGPGHVGRALPGVELRVGDGSDETEPAEIRIRGRNLFSGYWPDGHGGPDADGWFATGDIGYLKEGELFLVDRARELIGVSGFNVYPAEVETVIGDLEGVREVAVIGRLDPSAGERVVAFVVGSGVTPDLVAAHCAERLPRFKRPAAVHLVEELPRGATGKIRKGALRRLDALADQGPLPDGQDSP